MRLLVAGVFVVAVLGAGDVFGQGDDAAGQPSDTGDGTGVTEPSVPAPPAADDVLDSVTRFSDAVRARMPDWLRGEVFGIEAWQYLAAFLCVLLAFVLKKVSDFVFERTIIPAARKTRFKFDQLFAEALYKPLGVVFLVLGLFGAVAMLNIAAQSEGVRRFVVQALKVALAVDFLWFVFRGVDILAVYLQQMASRTESKLDDQLVPVIKKSLKFFVGVLVLVAMLQNMGYNVGSLLAGLGIGGLAVALAAKDTLANFFGGLVIFTDHPFRVGDWVRVGDVEGTVEQIGFRSTRIRTFPKTLVTIPNAKVVDDVVDNKTAMPVRRVRVSVGVTYETTADQMEALLEDLKAILRGDDGVDQEFIVVRFEEFGASSLNVRFQYFTKPVVYDEHLAVVERINLAVMRAIEARGLSIAFPTHTVYFEGDVAKAIAGRRGDERR